MAWQLNLRNDLNKPLCGICYDFPHLQPCGVTCCATPAERSKSCWEVSEGPDCTSTNHVGMKRSSQCASLVFDVDRRAVHLPKPSCGSHCCFQVCWQVRQAQESDTTLSLQTLLYNISKHQMLSDKLLMQHSCTATVVHEKLAEKEG